MSDFTLDPQLAKDCTLLFDLPLSRVLLFNDANYPWLVLVPRVADCKEIIDLSIEQQAQLWQESAKVSQVLQRLFKPDKLNIAALGNVVAQLHVHHIVRYRSDISWPKPVWGQHPTKLYDEVQMRERCTQLVEQLHGLTF
jgi:diadenosine tetraphosphate (Ap4A) HIT family hydrolase